MTSDKSSVTWILSLTSMNSDKYVFDWNAYHIFNESAQFDIGLNINSFWILKINIEFNTVV